MNPIELKFTELLKKDECGLMTHIIIGYPDIKTSEKLVLAMAKSGADFIELQIPFSEPIADGPVFFHANQESIKKGTKVKDAFDLMSRLTSQIRIPLLFMTYFNIVFRYGIEKFCKRAKKCGASGFIIPDIPQEEAGKYICYCSKYNLIPIFLITPTTSEERMRLIIKNAKGFIYCVARAGITGNKTDFHKTLKKFLKTIKKHTSLPLGVGFGVKNKEDVEIIGKYGEMAIVGTGILRAYNKGGIQNVSKLVSELKEACKK